MPASTFGVRLFEELGRGTEHDDHRFRERHEAVGVVRSGVRQGVAERAHRLDSLVGPLTTRPRRASRTPPPTRLPRRSAASTCSTHRGVERRRHRLRSVIVAAFVARLFSAAGGLARLLAAAGRAPSESSRAEGFETAEDDAAAHRRRRG